MSTASALVQKVRNPYFHQGERRDAERHIVSLEATSQPIDANESLSWGAVVEDISTTGVGLTLCYPFRPGTFLAVDIPTLSGTMRSMMVRVVRVDDQRDGMWRLGCEFVKPLSESDMDVIV
jgi:hypothetical protein